MGHKDKKKEGGIQLYPWIENEIVMYMLFWSCIKTLAFWEKPINFFILWLLWKVKDLEKKKKKKVILFTTRFDVNNSGALASSKQILKESRTESPEIKLISQTCLSDIVFRLGFWILKKLNWNQQKSHGSCSIIMFTFYVFVQIIHLPIHHIQLSILGTASIPSCIHRKDVGYLLRIVML